MTETEKFIKTVAETPAVALEATLDTSKQAINSVTTNEQVKKVREYWHILGPGLVTGASDDDPSGIATYSQAGAAYGLGLIWLSLFTFPLMAVVQEMCARIGMVTGEGLAANIKKYYPRWVLYTTTFLLFLTNILNIGADLGAMAKASQLLLPSASFILLIIFFVILSLGLQIFSSYKKYANFLKFLALLLLAYIFSAMSINLNWKEVMIHTFIPTINFSKDQIFLICAILGTTISPYLFFWQTAQEVEEEIAIGRATVKDRRGATDLEIKNKRTDVWSGMFLSNLVMYFIIAACAGTLFARGVTNINTASDAALALKPFAGDFAFLLFALGIIGTGMLAVPVLAGSASYAISESFGWDNGLFRPLKEALSFYGVIIISVIIGFLIDLFNLDPIKMLIYSAVLNGLIAPIILVLIILLSSNKKIMGQWTNSSLYNVFGWIITGFMIFAGVATIIAPFIH